MRRSRRRVPPLGGGHPVSAPEYPAEVGGACETPLASHCGDGPACRLAAGKLTSALLQPAALDPPTDSDVLGLENLVQVAYGDLVSAGYGLRRQVRIGEVVVDEFLDPRQQHPGCARRVTGHAAHAPRP